MFNDIFPKLTIQVDIGNNQENLNIFNEYTIVSDVHSFCLKHELSEECEKLLIQEIYSQFDSYNYGENQSSDNEELNESLHTNNSIQYNIEQQYQKWLENQLLIQKKVKQKQQIENQQKQNSISQTDKMSYNSYQYHSSLKDNLSQQENRLSNENTTSQQQKSQLKQHQIIPFKQENQENIDHPIKRVSIIESDNQNLDLLKKKFIPFQTYSNIQYKNGKKNKSLIHSQQQIQIPSDNKMKQVQNQDKDLFQKLQNNKCIKSESNIKKDINKSQEKQKIINIKKHQMKQQEQNKQKKNIHNSLEKEIESKLPPKPEKFKKEIPKINNKKQIKRKNEKKSISQKKKKKKSIELMKIIKQIESSQDQSMISENQINQLPIYEQKFLKDFIREKQNENQQLTFQPFLSRKTNQLIKKNRYPAQEGQLSIGSILFEESKLRKQRLNDLIKQHNQESFKEVTFKPHISDHSSKLANQNRALFDKQNNMGFHDRLYYQGIQNQQIKENYFEKQLNQEDLEDTNISDQTLFSSKEPISFYVQQQYMTKLAQNKGVSPQTQKYIGEKQIMEEFDCKTGQKLFIPKINKKSVYHKRVVEKNQETLEKLSNIKQKKLEDLNLQENHNQLFKNNNNLTEKEQSFLQKEVFGILNRIFNQFLEKNSKPKKQLLYISLQKIDLSNSSQDILNLFQKFFNMLETTSQKFDFNAFYNYCIQDQALISQLIEMEITKNNKKLKEVYNKINQQDEIAQILSNIKIEQNQEIQQKIAHIKQFSFGNICMDKENHQQQNNFKENSSQQKNLQQQQTLTTHYKKYFQQ